MHAPMTPATVLAAAGSRPTRQRANVQAEPKTSLNFSFSYYVLHPQHISTRPILGLPPTLPPPHRPECHPLSA